MEHLNCRGEKTRIEIVSKYNIKLLMYAKLLNGRTKRSDANENLTDKYYEFICILKDNDKIVKYITCGSGAGEHLLKLADIKKPTIFNPFISESNGLGGVGGNGGGTLNKTWNPIAKELYDAIRWLICCWDTPPYGKILEIKEDLEKYRNEPHTWKIKFVNNVIARDARGRSVSQMIEEIRNNDNNIRNFSFELINRKLKDENIVSHF